MKQGEGVSLSAQREAIEIFARRTGIEIVRWFEERETAAKFGRPVFNEMVRQLKAGKASGMIIHRIDRSSRNLKDWATISDLSDAGIDVYFATESLDFRSRGGRLTADIQAVIAADYIRNLSLEARKGIDGRLKQGIYPFPAPLGYVDNGGGKPKTLDPIRAPLVRELFERYLTGDYSIRTLHTTMVARGLTTRGNRGVSKHTVEHLLQNPFYCGLMRNGRTGELFPGIHEPLITPSQFERIAAIKSGRYVKKSTRHDHLLRRLFHCAVCTAVLTPERQKGRVYYRCHTVGCSTRTVREDALEAAVHRALARLELSEADRTKIDENYATWKADRGFPEELNAIELRIAQAEARLDRVADLLIDEKLDQTTHDRKRDAIQIEIARLKEERRALSERTADEEDRSKFLELMKTLAPLYESAKAPEKRVLVENCFSNRTWDGKCVYLEPSELVLAAKDDHNVPNGGPFRDTIRTFIKQFDVLDRGQQLDKTA